MPARKIKYLSQCPPHPHHIFYKEWGDIHNQNALFCAHGLTRNSGDFDYFCSKMEEHYHIICPDMPGRGQSDWLAKDEYHYSVYMADAGTLIAQLGAKRLDWVGTSMGGLMGMILASQPNTPIRKLVINDVGPFASRASQLTIGKYAGNDERFNTFEEVTTYFKNLYAAWGNVSEDQWLSVAKQSSRVLEDGTYALAYDPAIVAPLKGNVDALEDISIWPVYEAIQIPMLLLHGAESTIVPAALVEEMKQRNKNLEVVDFPGIGHAPSLMEDYQVNLVREWLRK
ncbi:MAG TPA: alpha/beta hydrolase [Burkholderiaceae bacterium]|jgi:pimeloyl-ACP methyl ester carboxylesterase